MKPGGEMKLPLVFLSLEVVLVYLFTNRITILPLAAGDNGMDKRNRTSVGHCHSAQLTLCPPQVCLYLFELKAA